MRGLNNASSRMKLEMETKMAFLFLVISLLLTPSNCRLLSASSSSFHVSTDQNSTTSMSSSSVGKIVLDHRNINNSTSGSFNGSTPMVVPTNANNTIPHWAILTSRSNNNDAAAVVHEYLSGTTALMVIVISIGFTLTGLLILWNRHRYSKNRVMCHYTTLHQELTLSPHDILYDAETAHNGDHLESASDELVSSEDEELLR